jgi:hypothetical protein
MFFMGNTVNKLLLIITGAVLLASISGTIMAFISPVEKEESINLANYQHKGEFDYIAYMKPSYLFSPELQELVTTSPSQKYFTEIIKSIDMTFTYVPEEEISAEVEVKAVLENHNVWQKEITLVPATTKNGRFTIEFPLDIEGLNQLFDTIDEELDIISLNREVTIVVNVINA